LGLELGGGSTLGVAQDPYARVLARGQAYLPLGEHADSVAQALRAGRLVLRAQFGAVLAREDAGIPSTQLFLTGGDTSVRGYNRGEIGLDLPGTQTTAGRYLAAGSAEWQRPIMDGGLATDWESAVFIDAGGVANTPHELQARIGVGAGIRWKSPVGPLQIDLAYGVPQGHLHLHMNVGFTF
jgi:translocation and assembly module TamA